MSRLYIVATPIGNLKDITLRALEVLREVDLVLAEDTRVARKLLSHFEIKTALFSFHKHSGKGSIKKILDLLEEGKNIALITDAGTPGISDPGQWLISLLMSNSKSIWDEGRTERGGASLQGFRTNEKPGSYRPYGFESKIEIIPIPGPSSITALISVADIDCSQFTFFGFPPHKKGRQTFFKKVAQSEIPTILFESPHRILKTLKELEHTAGDRYCNIGRELTKVYEEVFRGKLSEAQKYFVGERLRGEFVIIINHA